MLGLFRSKESAQRERMLAHIREVWERHAQSDPYFSVLTAPKYTPQNLSDEAIEEFYQSGFGVADGIKKTFAANGIALNQNHEVLDLGCGLGRNCEPMRSLFARYIGIDISSGHLEIARTRCSKFSNVEFQHLSDYVKSSRRFDVFFSRLVLQHNPPPVIEWLLDISLARLRPGGIAYFQVPCQLDNYSFDVDKYLAGEGQKKIMEMHALPRERIHRILGKHNLIILQVTPDNSARNALSYQFVAQKN
ncbi:MAG: class I SAM-dependent methyltransferase [Xanthobacteraceae bacterium]|nr:class I SAM-dependent methyltransferase [Xanthobacteraceae bacterium]